MSKLVCQHQALISINNKMKINKIIFWIIIFELLGLEVAKANLLDNLEKLKNAYPAHIQSVNEQHITWQDGTKMPVSDGKLNKSLQEKMDTPSLADQAEQWVYPVGKPQNRIDYHPSNDPGRIRYDPFFRKMYGDSAREVKKKLTTGYWMPKIFGKRYRFQVTTVNSVHEKLVKISEELERLVAVHPEFRKYLENPGGFFNWRVIANTKRLSSHSFGITVDINTNYANYWQWDLQKKGLPIKETTPLSYKNQIPWEIVLIFEKYGFIWGGKWLHYDTMHFEYRPEMFP